MGLIKIYKLADNVCKHYLSLQDDIRVQSKRHGVVTGEGWGEKFIPKKVGKREGIGCCTQPFPLAFRLHLTVCPRCSDPFYVLTYDINGSLLFGHIVIILD